MFKLDIGARHAKEHSIEIPLARNRIQIHKITNSTVEYDPFFSCLSIHIIREKTQKQIQPHADMQDIHTNTHTYVQLYTHTRARASMYAYDAIVPISVCIRSVFFLFISIVDYVPVFSCSSRL
jgi:hypothetical protein